jgi:beta-lactam-binding protein with PASTA domain
MFVSRRVVMVTKVVMPDVVGITFGQADRLLGNLGIVFFDDANEGPTTSGSIVITQSLPPGSVLHPPAFQASLGTRRPRSAE